MQGKHACLARSFSRDRMTAHKEQLRTVRMFSMMRLASFCMSVPRPAAAATAAAAAAALGEAKRAGPCPEVLCTPSAACGLLMPSQGPPSCHATLVLFPGCHVMLSVPAVAQPGRLEACGGQGNSTALPEAEGSPVSPRWPAGRPSCTTSCLTRSTLYLPIRMPLCQVVFMLVSCLHAKRCSRKVGSSVTCGNCRTAPRWRGRRHGCSVWPPAGRQERTVEETEQDSKQR